MTLFTYPQESISGLPTINFTFDGQLGHAVLGGATLSAVASTEDRADVSITDGQGEVLADVMVRLVATDENITVAVMRVGSALLWSHWRYLQASAPRAPGWTCPTCGDPKCGDA